MAPRKQVPPRARTRARIGCAAAHNRPRCIEARPSASGTPAVARRRAEGGAYLGQRGDRGGVPRADVRVELRRHVERLRTEAARGPRRRNGLAWFGADTGAQKHAPTHARECRARTHWWSDPPCSYAHRCSYVHLLRLAMPYVCVFHRRGVMKRERRPRAHAVQSRIVSTRTRPRVCASVKQQHTRSHMHIRGVHRYMHTSDPCMPTYTGAHTRAHDVAGRIVGVTNRTHVHMDAMQPRARSPPIRHKSIHLSIDIGPVHGYM